VAASVVVLRSEVANRRPNRSLNDFNKFQVRRKKKKFDSRARFGASNEI
jgi:hypothetical protein